MIRVAGDRAGAGIVAAARTSAKRLWSSPNRSEYPSVEYDAEAGPADVDLSVRVLRKIGVNPAGERSRARRVDVWCCAMWTFIRPGPSMS
jgi:hypothetical protein